MSLSNIDKSRALRTEDELRALVDAIHSSPPNTQETNWLEWKSTLDLGTPEGRFAVSKAILGFANRSPAQAQLAMEGVAYMVVGVEPGSAAGVPAFDHATLGQRIKTYADGPRWTPHYIGFSGVEVLVIVIEPPRSGDPMHSLQKTYTGNTKGTGHQAGAVFHRGAAHTEPAGPKEIEMLGERLLHGVRQPDLDLALVSASDPLTRLRVNRDEVEDWLTRHEVFVRANSGAPPPPPPPTPPPPKTPERPFDQLAGLSGAADLYRFSGLGSAFTAGLYAKSEDAETFDKRVSVYLAKLRRGLLAGNLIRGIVRSDENKVQFSVGNMTDDPVSGVQLTVVVPKAGLRVHTSPPSVDQLPPLPKWPDQFRDRMVGLSAPALSQQHYDFDPHAGAVVETAEAFEVTWDVGDLRPGEWSGTLEITVVAGQGAPDEVHVEMIARAMDRRRNATEKVVVTVGADVWTVDDWFVAQPEKRKP
ncbi:hypothetical protein H7J51_24925 [Mycobacterium crocinum]|uniref:ATP-binding protein n=1 Tax=Mycolicibacterium crocinum TaxID=388459 RepID=A0ABY3TN63_9MYCO|nr:hypothetical protein [Mycolicibacterium crocinum]MCV7218508.1 hypothetical protein [Mycolicibacterium crocinum]ULN40397.1 hypothetical protein MI149_22435 [Mycolicibacterium crocinum]